MQYYLASGFYEIVLTALSDSDSAVRTAALESLKVLSLLILFCLQIY